MIIVTGAAGFIGSYLCGVLNQQGYNNLVICDLFRQDREANLESKKYIRRVDRNDLMNFIDENHIEIEFIFHIGARTDTTLFDRTLFDELNLNYSKKLWELSVKYSLPFIYASSAATYGDGSLGYDDDHSLVPKLQPLNDYGWSKQWFDMWVLEQAETPPFWAGFKFFNVYGPNEYHKGRMASVIFHAFNQIKSNGALNLFKSHNPNYSDGGQMRDFIYVKDLCQVLIYFFETRKHSGIYNLGTGKAETFNTLGSAVFTALGKVLNIKYVDTPADIRSKYQYYTQANTAKLSSAGYQAPFTSLTEGTIDYVKNYLVNSVRF